jgi:hypothetical protein
LPIIGDELREPALIHSNTVFEQRGRLKGRPVGLKGPLCKKKAPHERTRTGALRPLATRMITPP